MNSHSDLYKIGIKSKSNKFHHHGYHRFYDKYIKRDIKKLLEIGLDDGKNGYLWCQYCPEANIYRLDVNNEYSHGKLTVYKGDQSSADDLEKLVSRTGDDIDVIIDDSSHIPEHQLFTFNKLFSHVKPGGIYIIEDIETSYWKNGCLYGYKTRYGKDHQMNIINVFRDVLHLLNREVMNIDDVNQIRLKCPILLDNIDSISSIIFGKNCIIICRKELYEYQYVNRSYRYPQMI